jgi:tyrosine-protein kinase Etk/Wzc
MADEVTSLQLAQEIPMGPPPGDGGWGNGPTLAPARSPLERPVAAIMRYKWLFLGVVLLATAGGVIATRFVKPDYETHATLWIASQTPQDAGGPIRSRELLNPTAWVDLLKSYRITDAVVRRLALYVKADKPADEPLLAGLSISDRSFPGDFVLHVDKKTRRWTLLNKAFGKADSGSVGDSIGRPLGVLWLPDAKLMAQAAGHDVKFSLATPRETSMELATRLTAYLPLKSNFLNLTLTDADPVRATRTLNALSNEYVKVAGDLKRKNSVEFAALLAGQLEFAEASLKDAESALENFRIHTITLPAEGGGPVTAGLEDSRAPVMKAYFDRKIEADNIKHDREALEKALAGAQAGTLPLQSMLFVPTVVTTPGGEQLRASFGELDKLQASLNTLRQTFRDEYPAVKDLIGQIETLKTRTIPGQANELLTQLKDREADFDKRISSASEDLQSIPVRTIEEMRLKRSVMVGENLYANLKARYAEAKLSEASESPDVNILDSAVTPNKPTKNTAPRLLGIAIFGGLGAAIALVLFLDSIDGRIRYPDQATKDLGLNITATVPELPKSGQQTPEEISQLIESFRTMRMNVMHSGSAQIAMAVSSPSPGDGKSFVSSNLAMSFADAGFRTILVDGDTRRGALHDMFGLQRTPGLTDLLSGEVDHRAIVQPTGHDNLFLIPTGTMRRGSPELLTSPALGRLVTDLRARYDVIIFDTPPLAAGVDGYAIAAATGSLLVVLRIGQTEKRMAAAKLLLVDRLPINVIGSVLNAAPSKGEYEYYGYVSGYGTEGLEPGRQVAQIS